MKRTALSLIAIASLLLVLGAATAGAQVHKVKAVIPFDFTVGQTSLPAGEYDAIPTGVTGAVIAIRNTSGKAAAMVITSAEDAKGDVAPKLVFHRYGNRYFLYQIWMDGGNTVRQLSKTRLEAELAMGNSDAREVTVMAQLR